MSEPTHNPILIGHDDALRQVREAFTGGRMHHAWLVSGIEGIGKATMACHIAHYVLSKGENTLGNINQKHPVAKLINACAHPDLLIVGRAANDKGELRNVIVVDDALKIASFLHKTATHDGWRVVIVDEAHALNRHGQNAILKILEEPPARALIVMTTTSPGALLPTIRSRCRLLPLEPLDEPGMKAVLARFAPEASDGELDNLVGLAGGSAGFALKIIRTETLPLYSELRALLQVMPELDIARLHKLADKIGRKADAESFDVLTTLLLDILRQSVQANARKGGGREEPLASLSVDRALQLFDKTRTTFNMAENANLDRKLAFINAISDIRRAVA
ncbi:MAG: DNA polymerase III subunit delta' [Bdellovibrionales bacterium]